MNQTSLSFAYQMQPLSNLLIYAQVRTHVFSMHRPHTVPLRAGHTASRNFLLNLKKQYNHQTESPFLVVMQADSIQSAIRSLPPMFCHATTLLSAMQFLDTAAQVKRLLLFTKTSTVTSSMIPQDYMHSPRHTNIYQKCRK